MPCYDLYLGSFLSFDEKMSARIEELKAEALTKATDDLAMGAATTTVRRGLLEFPVVAFPGPETATIEVTFVDGTGATVRLPDRK